MSAGAVQVLCETGRTGPAVDLLHRSCHTSLPAHLYLLLLKTCVRNQAFVHARKVYAHLCQFRVPLTGTLGDYVVVALAKSGAVDDAARVSFALRCRTVFSWTAIISAYADCGRGREALAMYQRMVDDGVEPNAYTFASLFKACGSVRDLEQGRDLHRDAGRMGCVSDIFVASSLVSMYGKCGDVEKAENVFKELKTHNTVLCNAMLSVYIERDMGERALELYERLSTDYGSPDQLTLLLASQACALLAEKGKVFPPDPFSDKLPLIEYGLTLHMDAEIKGFTTDVALENTFISMYGKCGALHEAEYVFCNLSYRTTVSWRAMLSAYIDQERGEKALQLYRKMRNEEGILGELTFVLALQACAYATETDGIFITTVSHKIVKALHGDIHKNGLTASNIICASLLTMYAKCGSISEAEHVFSSMFHHNVVSWNAMLSAYIKHDQERKVLQLYVHMQHHCVKPNRRTYVLALQACVNLAEKEDVPKHGNSTCLQFLEIGRALHQDVSKHCFMSDPFITRTLLSMYGKCGEIAEAENVFNSMDEPSTILCTAMLSVYLENARPYEVLLLHEKMQRQCQLPNDVTLICVLQACGTTGSLEFCRQVHFSIICASYDLIPTVVATLIHAYGNCASMVEAHAIFEKLLGRDIVSWNACIAGHLEQGNFSACFDMFETMKRAGIKPDKATFASVLSACSHIGHIDKGLEHFDLMMRDHGVEPELKHYGSMLDLLGRTGEFQKLESMLQSMPMHANLVVWLCLLDTCRMHGNVKLTKHIFSTTWNQEFLS